MRCFLFIFLVIFSSCRNAKSDNSSNNLITDELEIVDFEGLKKYLNSDDDTTYVVNFWATWCAPCIKELPYFEMLQQNYAQEIEVILVSLDFPNQYDTKLKPYIKDNNIKSKVIALDDIDMNSWIPQVDPNWDGAIPITIIHNRDKRQFYNEAFTYASLENELKNFIN